MSKFLSLLCMVCMVVMAGLVSYFGVHIPDHWTIGKTLSAIFFFGYEAMCLIGAIYFWMKD